MNRINIQNKIEELLDGACDNLGSEEFKILLKRVEEMIENYERMD